MLTLFVLFLVLVVNKGSTNPLASIRCTDLDGLNSNLVGEAAGKNSIESGCNLLASLVRGKEERERGSRQNDEDNEELPELALPILQIIGSALAGNASALIDNSIALIPSEITSIISNSLNVLVSTINSARPSSSTERSASSIGVAGDGSSTTTGATRTETTEEDEDYNEGTTESILRTNSSSQVNTTTPASTASPVTTNPPSQAQLAFNLSNPGVRETQRINKTTTMKEISDNMAMMLLSMEASLDADNKANWLPLVMSTENISQPMFATMFENMQQPSDDIDVDNKANWASIFNTDAPSPTSYTPGRPQKQSAVASRENGRNPGSILSESVGSKTQAVSLTRNGTDSKVKGSLKDQLSSLLGMNKPLVFNYSANFANAIKTIDSLQSFIATTSPPLPLGSSLGDLLGEINSLLNGTSLGLNQNLLKVTMTTPGKTSATTNLENYEAINSFEITSTLKNNGSSSNETSTASSGSPTKSTTEDDEDEDEDEDNSDNAAEE